MEYNGVIVCVTVINLTNAFFFVGLDRSRLTNLIDLIADYECSRYTAINTTMDELYSYCKTN